MILQTIKASVLKFVKDEDGLTVVEYAVAGGLIAAVTVAAFRALGITVTGVITGIDAALAG
ncbi:MAG: pilus assembly protein PilA [Pseudomonadales bacterium RIFCSPLOWO2_12_59_9]|nr:MAG: pilus assembly protein PilA [Pseudomonadales bacterium RIFCSPLOWO2_12_59_9]